jgi:hypothetical protein
MTHQRLKVWSALSNLFLDNELQETDREFICNQLAQTSYTLSEIERILWNELYPILKYNLISVAGEWAGFDEEWLLANIKINNFDKRPFFMFTFPASSILDEWQKIRFKLSDE